MFEKVQAERLSRLALGTAQFGLLYGVANLSGRVAAAAVDTILRRAKQAGIDTLDTAVSYGDSESTLGNAGVSSWRVITKLPPLPSAVHDVSEWAVGHVHTSLKRLRIAQLEGLLLHRPADLLGPAGSRYRDVLRDLKAQGFVRAVGLSIYDPAELDAVWHLWQPEIVQAPCNVLDRRLIRSGWLAKLSSHGVRIHVRSVFLQGLLLMSSAQRPAWFARWKQILDRWLAWCDARRVLPLHAAIAYAAALPGIERIVIGVDSLAQLEEILAARPEEVPLPPEDLYSDDQNLLEPSKWKLT